MSPTFPIACDAPEEAAPTDVTVPAEVVAAAQRGEVAAQERLLRGLQDVIYRFCLAQLGEAEATEDATQETALRLLRRLDNFRGDSQIKTFALGIALNVCRESRRQAKRFPAEGLPIDETPSSQAAASEAFQRNEAHARLHRLLDRLSARQREIVVLRYLEQLSVAETAATVGVATGTVKATAAQALAKIRQWWSE